MSRELTNGATGWRFVTRILAMPFALIWTLLDLHPSADVEQRAEIWTDGTN